MNVTAYTKRFSYAASDMAGQLLFCVVSFYILKFYTDVFGLSAAAAGTVLLLARCTDAVDAPVWGMIFDRTKSRWGRSRPWFLWLCVPFGVMGVLTFTTPDWSDTAKFWYAVATYITFSILYTGINTPVTSILATLTPDSKERITLTSFRMLGSKAGVLIVNVTALSLVAWLGGGDDKKGFALTVPIYATGAIILYLIAFFNLREIVGENAKPLPIKGMFGAMKGNWPWILIFISSFFFWIAFLARIVTVPFFFQYVLHRKDLISLANSLDFISLGTIVFLPFLCRWTLKRNVWMSGLIGMVIGQVMVYCGVHAGASLPIIFTGWIVGWLASGMALTIPFSILSDSVDYGEWKTGIRAAGLLTAVGAGFCLKAGSGLGAALPAWIMGAYGYVPNVSQTATSLHGIEIGFIWLPVGFFALSIIPVLFYKKYELMEPQIQAELEKRRAAALRPATL
jgi:sugar (glycoside-pentoside-hexuronide) transporter